MSALEMTSVSAGYGSSVVLHEVTLTVEKGEAVGVLGANGAGKTTLMRVLAGQLRARSGRVALSGHDLGRTSASGCVRRGLVLVPEDQKVIGSLTVDENLALGAFRFWPKSKRIKSEMEPLVHELFPVLAERRGQLAGLLSGGEQQMLAISRALMAKPDVLLLDEPSLGLAPVVVDTIYERLNVLRDGDLSILLVEQNADRAVQFCDRLYVLRLGEFAVAGADPGALEHESLRAAYFGS